MPDLYIFVLFTVTAAWSYTAGVLTAKWWLGYKLDINSSSRKLEFSDEVLHAIRKPSSEEAAIYAARLNSIVK